MKIEQLESLIYNLEELCKVRCYATNCENNLVWKGLACCNLKSIDIDYGNVCKGFKEKERI